MNNSNFFEVKLESSDFRKLMNEYRKEKKHTDVQLKVGDKIFDAHKNVISLYSPVLKAAISDQWLITTICPISEEYVDPEIVEDLLSYLYTGYIKLTPDNVHAVCIAAHFLQIQTLLEPSVKYLCQLATVENVLSLFQFSSSCQLRLLHKRCLLIILDNYETLLESDQILQFSFEDFIKVIDVLKERFPRKVPVKTLSHFRDILYHCIVRWTEKDFIERSNHFPNLLKNIPLQKLVSSSIAEAILQCDQINEFSLEDFNNLIIGLEKHLLSAELDNERILLAIEQNFE